MRKVLNRYKKTAFSTEQVTLCSLRKTRKYSYVQLLTDRVKDLQSKFDVRIADTKIQGETD